MPPTRTFFFYQGDNLSTVKTGEESRGIFRGVASIAHAELHTDNAQSALLATDDKGSVLQVQSNEGGKSDTDQP